VSAPPNARNLKTGPDAIPRGSQFASLFAAFFGAFLGLALLKFGNPPIFEKWVTAPADGYELLLGYPWPITWAYGLLALLCLVGLGAARWQLPRPRWILVLPAAWLAWQFLAATQSLDPTLSAGTVRHFAACTACFYVGVFVLGHANRNVFWICLSVALVVVLGLGFEQHFGGLEETRRYFFLYLYPKMNQFPPEYLKKLSSNRIFGTLFYPNALAGALLLVMPPVVAAVLQIRRMTTAAKSFLAGLIVLAGFCCLYWSGSKGGWLLMVFLGVVGLLHLPVPKRWKVVVVAMVVMAGTAGFALKYAGFFRRGATSVVARFDYWRAAVQTTAAHPVMGTGPGTFAIPYERIKRPESEMSRLVHNDYLEQATDSGIIGFLTYTAFVAGILWVTRPAGLGDPVRFATWLGVLGWGLQGLVEFGLYVPALAWPAFAFMGLLLHNRGLRQGELKSFDKPEGAALPSGRR